MTDRAADSILTSVTEWMPHQRWYSSKGSAPRLRVLADHPLATDDLDAIVRVLIVIDESAMPPITYQVPIVQRTTSSDAAHVIGRTPSGGVVIDGPHDTAYTSALLRQVSPESASAAASVITGEQSNTSIIFRPPSAPPVICKIFRQLNPGLSPDIELQFALTGGGSNHVPRALGHTEATWRDPLDPGTTCTGSLAFAQEFLPGVEDAWRVALRAATAGRSFTTPAHALGTATADVHLSLAELFPTAQADDDARAAVSAAWQRRLAIAIAEVPQLQRHRGAIAAVYERALNTDWPPLQRIHGDFHLGQVLHDPDRGWVLVDFEGEPMRPIGERRLPDSALRDVAGMLRSFDYIAGSLPTPDAPDTLAQWALESRTAFLAGYEDRRQERATGPLLDAFELDKAVYEAIYEARNRPDWLPIPLTAIDRLVAPPRDAS